MKKTLIVMVDEELHGDLRREAFKCRISMSEITRRALNSYLINKPAQGRTEEKPSQYAIPGNFFAEIQKK